MSDDLAEVVRQLAQAQIDTQNKLQTLCDTLVTADTSSPSEANRGPAVRASPTSVTGPDLQALARQIADKYKSVPLDNNHRLHEDRTGIKREDQKLLNVISRCGRFVETGLKILQTETSEDGAVSALRAGELYSVFCAHLAYLQDEYGCTFVGSLGDQTTAKVFRQLRKNTSALPPDAIDDLRCAAQVAASFPQQRSAPSSNHWRGGYRGRGRGYGRGTPRPQYAYQRAPRFQRGNSNQQDPFNRMVEDIPQQP